MFGLRVGKLGGIALTGAMPAVFSPASLFANGEQGAWYDPSDFSTMFQDSAGTTPVTAVGQPVGLILDKSGNDTNAFQATAAARPLLQQDGNGKYYLDFGGVDDALATAVFSLTSVQTVSIWFGSYISNSSPGFVYEFSPNGNTNVGSFNAYYNEVGDGGLTGRTNVGTQSGNTAVAVAIPNLSVYSMVHDGTVASPSVRSRRNGATYSNGGNNSAFPASFGTWALNVGSRQGGFHLPGRLYSLIVRGAPSTEQEITDTETWVNGKTGAY